MKYIFILNPAAGNGLSEEKRNDIIDKFESKGHEIILHVTKSLKDINKIILNTKEICDAYIIAGGDGTIREMIKHLTINNCQHPLGILATGTGNDFVKSLGLNKSIDESIEIILNNKTRDVYIGEVNNDIFVNVVSMGLDAEIVNMHNKLKHKIKSKLSYVISAIVMLMTYKGIDIKVVADGKTHNNDYLLIAVANGKYYGGGMMIAPDASVYEPKLQICAVKKINKFILLFLFPLLFTGGHKNFWCVDYFKCDNIKIETKDTSYLNYDGELTEGKSIEVSKKKNKIQKIFAL